MNLWQIHHNTMERMSEEVHSDVQPIPVGGETNQFFESSFEDLFANPDLSDFEVSGECDSFALMDSIGTSTEPHEFDRYLGPDPLASSSQAAQNHKAMILQLFPEEPPKKCPAPRQSVPLSRSVGVGQPRISSQASRSISIVYELEETFRPRYKSDYFAQNGKNRKPRYVADRKGNHYITLRVPPGTQGLIRVDWLTVRTPEGELFSMPYRFQESNELPLVPDSNPIYVRIDADAHGLMKLYLVLIKSKQDELKSLQPLKPFRPVQDAFGIPEKKSAKLASPLVPKQLIQKYQLDKSQLAFTYCGLSSDGTKPIPEWDTTVFSTVLTETSPETPRQKAVSCPNCAHAFQVSIPNFDEEQQPELPAQVQKRKQTPLNFNQLSVKKQRSFDEEIDFQ